MSSKDSEDTRTSGNSTKFKTFERISKRDRIHRSSLDREELGHWEHRGIDCFGIVEIESDPDVIVLQMPNGKKRIHNWENRKVSYFRFMIRQSV